MNRARLLALLLLAAASLRAQQLPPVALETIASGLPPLTSVTNAGDERLFLTTLDGRVLVVSGGEVGARPLLDIRGLVRSGGEQGLLSVAFHPLWPAVSFLFVNYTDHAGATVVARYLADRDVIKPRTARVVLRIQQPFENHNGGQLQFGPDRYLYVGMGDGGAGNDPHCNAQRGGTLLGKLLRIDVDQYRRRGPWYGVPRDNPFAGGGAQPPEVWAIGLRNPWRFSFDRETGDLYLSDVGQGAREEIDFQPASSAGGENYGWAREEGSVCLDEVSACPDVAPPCGDPALQRPILQYGREDGSCAVIGGYVYRGSAIAGLAGAYLFGDFCSGRLWGAVRTDGGWRSVELEPTMPDLTSFGEDAAGEIYLVSHQGVLARLVSR
ncbi:MAG TPA: PQQ-dependent sugar dehydrogenase [Thermoanaerobaculia bacterium]|nr:PQQ-dependent sugar dehydrogenase [Thermoanaerobaculia bacterium]